MGRALMGPPNKNYYLWFIIYLLFIIIYLLFIIIYSLLFIIYGLLINVLSPIASGASHCERSELSPSLRGVPVPEARD